MTVEMKPTFIPADLHKWLKRLAVENDTTVQLEHELALREAQAMREAGQSIGIATQAEARAMAVRK